MDYVFPCEEMNAGLMGSLSLIGVDGELVPPHIPTSSLTIQLLLLLLVLPSHCSFCLSHTPASSHNAYA